MTLIKHLAKQTLNFISVWVTVIDFGVGAMHTVGTYCNRNVRYSSCLIFGFNYATNKQSFLDLHLHLPSPLGTTVRDLKMASYLSWGLSSPLPSVYDMEIQVMFRTRDTDGVLFTSSSDNSNHEMTLEVCNKMNMYLTNPNVDFS